jgi:hypothetical protein
VNNYFDQHSRVYALDKRQFHESAATRFTGRSVHQYRAREKVRPGSHDTSAARAPSVKEMKARQNSKIREIADALRTAGFIALDEQASALGLCRSTAWTIIQGRHKSSGLSASIINRMLVAPRLPQIVRAKILEYVEEKTAGLYGDSNCRLCKFEASLSINSRGTAPSNGARVGNVKSRRFAATATKVCATSAGATPATTVAL